jgi:hypothetical protein
MIMNLTEISFLSFSSGLTLIILFMSLAIFGWLSLRYRNIRSFEFQILIFIIVYVVGEIIEDYKIPFFSAFPYIGSQIHILSAVFLAIMLWLRLYSVRKSGRNMIDKMQPAESNISNGGTESK